MSSLSVRWILKYFQNVFQLLSIIAIIIWNLEFGIFDYKIDCILCAECRNWFVLHNLLKMAFFAYYMEHIVMIIDLFDYHLFWWWFLLLIDCIFYVVCRHFRFGQVCRWPHFLYEVHTFFFIISRNFVSSFTWVGMGYRWSIRRVVII